MKRHLLNRTPGRGTRSSDSGYLLFDVQRLVRERQRCGATQSDEVLPKPMSKQEIVQKQKLDDFCQPVHTIQLSKKGILYFEDEDGMLCLWHPRDQTMIQAVLSSSLRHRLLRLAHHTPISGHPGQTRLHRRLQRSYYWPHMAADISANVRECTPCAKNRLRLLRKASEMKRCPAAAPRDSVAIDILEPLPKSSRGFIFMIVISDRFTKLTQVVPLERITAYDVAVAFVEHLVFKYGAPATLLSDNGSQFVAHFFRRVCNILQVHNVFTTTYPPQTIGQVERFNRTLAAMLRCYVDDKPGLWCLYTPALCNAYNMSVECVAQCWYTQYHRNHAVRLSPQQNTARIHPSPPTAVEGAHRARPEKRLRPALASSPPESIKFSTARTSALQKRL